MPRPSPGRTTRRPHQQLFADKTDFDDAQRGFMGTIANGTFKADDGRTSWDLNKYSFLKGEAPDTVNPSLWRIQQRT